MYGDPFKRFSDPPSARIHAEEAQLTQWTPVMRRTTDRGTTSGIGLLSHSSPRCDASFPLMNSLFLQQKRIRSTRNLTVAFNFKSNSLQTVSFSKHLLAFLNELRRICFTLDGVASLETINNNCEWWKNLFDFLKRLSWRVSDDGIIKTKSWVKGETNIQNIRFESLLSSLSRQGSKFARSTENRRRRKFPWQQSSFFYFPFVERRTSNKAWITGAAWQVWARGPSNTMFDVKTTRDESEWPLLKTMLANVFERRCRSPPPWCACWKLCSLNDSLCNRTIRW